MSYNCFNNADAPQQGQRKHHHPPPNAYRNEEPPDSSKYLKQHCERNLTVDYSKTGTRPKTYMGNYYEQKDMSTAYRPREQASSSYRSSAHNASTSTHSRNRADVECFHCERSNRLTNYYISHTEHVDELGVHSFVVNTSPIPPTQPTPPKRERTAFPFDTRVSRFDENIGCYVPTELSKEDRLYLQRLSGGDDSKPHCNVRDHKESDALYTDYQDKLKMSVPDSLESLFRRPQLIADRGVDNNSDDFETTRLDLGRRRSSTDKISYLNLFCSTDSHCDTHISCDDSEVNLGRLNVARCRRPLNSSSVNKSKHNRANSDNSKITNNYCNNFGNDRTAIELTKDTKIDRNVESNIELKFNDDMVDKLFRHIKAEQKPSIEQMPSQIYEDNVMAEAKPQIYDSHTMGTGNRPPKYTAQMNNDGMFQNISNDPEIFQCRVQPMVRKDICDLMCSKCQLRWDRMQARPDQTSAEMKTYNRTLKVDRLLQLRDFQNSLHQKFARHLREKNRGRCFGWDPTNVYNIENKRCVCPTANASCYPMTAANLLSHLINVHVREPGVEFRELYEGDKWLVMFHPSAVEFRKPTCLSVLAYGGFRGEPDTRPIIRYMPVKNLHLPSKYDHLIGHLPLMLMVCRTTWFAMIGDREVEDRMITAETMDKLQILVVWVVSMQTMQPVHVMLTAFDKRMTATRTSIVQIRDMLTSQDCSEFLRKDVDYLRLTNTDINILTEDFREPIFLELTLREYSKYK